MLVWKTGKKLLLCASVLILHGFFLSASALFLVRPHTKIKDEFLVELSSATKPCKLRKNFLTTRFPILKNDLINELYP